MTFSRIIPVAAALSILCALAAVTHGHEPVELPVTAFVDSSYPDAEPTYAYPFEVPVRADVLAADPDTHVPLYGNRYFMSLFGPRYMRVSTSNVECFDFHQGQDITASVTFDGKTFDEDNPPEAYSMCAGTIDEIFDGSDPEMESTTSGRYVRVRCDATFAASDWGHIYMAYLHLGSVADELAEGARIARGSAIGVIGASGTTSFPHLHFSVRRLDGGSFINVHPMRAFDPTSSRHVLDYLADAEISQLEYDATSALFRVAIPNNQANIRAIHVDLADGSYSRVYDFEDVSENAGAARDDNGYVGGLELFAYPFNHGHSAFYHYIDDKDDMPAAYPASPARGASRYHAILNQDLSAGPSYVLDVFVTDLPDGYDIDTLQLEVIDIYGHGVRASGTSAVDQAGTQTFAIIEDKRDDAEESSSGSVEVNSTRLELVANGSKGDQMVGVRFLGLGIPQGSTITDAFIQFMADGAAGDATELMIRVEDADDSARFRSSSRDLTSRAVTGIGVSWTLPPWSTSGAAGLAQRTPDLSAIVQEAVDRSGWTEASPLTFLITGTGKRVAESHDSARWRSPYLVVRYRAAGSPSGDEPTSTVFETRVVTGNDDVEEHENGSIAREGTDLELSYDSYVSATNGLYGQQHIGLRFQAVSVPQGARIVNAYIQFTADETGGDPASLTIHGEDTSSAAEFTYTYFSVSGREATDASVTWEPGAWSEVGRAGPAERTPDLATIVQEIVDRPDWQSDNAMVFVVSGSGTRTAESYDGSSSDAPRLHVEYEID